MAVYNVKMTNKADAQGIEKLSDAEQVNRKKKTKR